MCYVLFNTKYNAECSKKERFVSGLITLTSSGSMFILTLFNSTVIVPLVLVLEIMILGVTNECGALGWDPSLTPQPLAIKMNQP